MNEKLADGKYKEMPFGVYLNYQLIKKKIQFNIKLRKFEDAKEDMEKLTEAQVEIGID